MATQQGGAEVRTDDIAPCLTAMAGMSGNNQPAVCFGIGSFDSNGMKSDSPHSGIYEAQVAKTLDLNGGNPACNQGGTAVVFGKGTRPHSTDEPQTWREAEVASTLNVFDSGEARAAELVIAPAVAKTLRQNTGLSHREDADTYVLGRPQGAYGVGNGQVNQADLREEVVGALTCMHDQHAVMTAADGYAVRRLTPIECARLQGFPDWWGELPTIEDMSAEQYRFWCAILLENAKIAETARWDELMGCFMVWRWVSPDKTKGEDFAPYWLDTGKPYKDKTKRQMIAWYNKLHTDSAEYKMWGNGVALPVVRVPLHGMAALGARTLGSLFDGSGGFPLAGVLEGITPLWSSEVEPYPIAVTLARFGDGKK